MGKIKKGRKGAKEEDSSSDVEIETQEIVDAKNSKKTKTVNKKAVEVASDGETNEKVLKKKKGKAQKGKKHEETDSDEPEDAAPKNGKNKQDKRKNSDGDIEKPTKVSNKKSGKHKKNESDESDSEQVPVSKVAKSFALLEVDSDPDVDSDKDVLSDSEVTQIVKKDNKKNVKESEVRTKEGKKSKKNRRKRDDSDDDIDKALAELALEHGIETDTKPKEEEAELEDEIKVKTKKKGKQDKEEVKTEGVTEEDEQGSTVKTAAQKKKEKKEREKLKKKQDVTKVETSAPVEETVVAEEPPSVVQEGEDGEKESKKKKKKGAKVVEEKDPKKGPNKKMIQQMQEALRKTQEEQDRLQREEEERIRKEEEAEDARLEALRIEKERKEKKKQREKERKERLKAEGKFLTPKQKADRARAQAMIDNLKAQGLELPDVGEKKPRLGTRIKPSRLKPQKSIEKEVEKVEDKPEEKIEEPKVEEEIVEEAPKESDDDVKDAWDASSSEEEESEETPAANDKKPEANEDSDMNTDESSDENSEEEEEGEHKTDAEKRKEKAKARIEQRKIDAEKNRTLDNLRAAVVCVLGHVDTGKTKILDKLRRTNVQDGEAGGITQQIGATNVPIDAIREQIKHVKGFSNMEFKLPGLLIIDTPGHESFSNLRSRGSSLCDIAILVVDIMHGLEPQTIESLNLLKNKKTPFVVALNKVDRLYDWQTMNRRDVSDIIKGQAPNTQLEFEQRKNEVIVQFAEQGLNAALCYENPDERSYVSLVPTSAVTGEGMGNLLSLIVDHCQNRLTKRLMFSEDLQATVLEVKAIPGLGTTIDAILINGTLREGDTMILAGTEGPITTQIRSLLMPQPMKELRVKNAYVEYKSIQAAQGVKIAAKELEKSIAGLNLYIAQHPDEVELIKEVVAKELKSALSGIKLQERGVYVQASTLGSLEALLEFLRTSKIPYSGIRIGPVVKKDVMKASIMLEHDSQYATILAFDVKIERDAQELADNLGVRIFQADIIYHLFDKFMAYTAELKAKKREEFKNIAVFPCKLRILPQFVFNSRDPIVVGVIVENGIVKEGTPICVPSKEFVEIGIVTGLEVNHKNVESARKGMEVCVKIEPIPGESPKMFGRHFDDKDFLISKISRQSIDACKEHFREDLTKTDWALMVELKKMFQIL